MTFPSGGPGYPQQGGGAQPNPQAPGPGGYPQQQQGGPNLSSVNLPMVLTLVVAVLGLVNYFIGFSDEASSSDQALLFLLVGGLLAGISLIPRAPRTQIFAVLFSVLGGLYAILSVVRVPSGADTPGIMTVILILGLLQLLVAVASLLFEYNVIKLPAPQQQGPPYAQQPYGQQPGFGQQQPQQGPEGKGPQGTQFTPPVAPQSTVYAPQAGQFYTPQQQDPGQQNPPGTPPGGISKS